MPVYVRATLTLQHVSLLTLKGVRMPFLAVPTAAVETVSATLAQCPDGGREEHLKYVSCELYQMYEWSILSSVYQSRTNRVVDTESDE